MSASVPSKKPSLKLTTVQPRPPSPRQPLPKLKDALSSLDKNDNLKQCKLPLPLPSSIEIIPTDFPIHDYKSILDNVSIEKELLTYEYTPLHKIVTSTGSNNKIQFIKALNSLGQKVYIYVDINGFIPIENTDIALIESSSPVSISYSMKTGAYNCVQHEVCGVAFECGSDSVCTLTRLGNDITPVENNYTFSDPSSIKSDNNVSIMSIPIILLSEIRANPDLVLSNTDIVTRRLRNATYQTLLQDLAITEQAISNLHSSIELFQQRSNDIVCILSNKLLQYKNWNNAYITNPPQTDEFKEKHKLLRAAMARRNDEVTTILRIMRKIADKRDLITSLSSDINEISDFCASEFSNVSID